MLSALGLSVVACYTKLDIEEEVQGTLLNALFLLV